MGLKEAASQANQKGFLNDVRSIDNLPDRIRKHLDELEDKLNRDELLDADELLIEVVARAGRSLPASLFKPVYRIAQKRGYDADLIHNHFEADCHASWKNGVDRDTLTRYENARTMARDLPFKKAADLIGDCLLFNWHDHKAADTPKRHRDWQKRIASILLESPRTKHDNQKRKVMVLDRALCNINASNTRPGAHLMDAMTDRFDLKHHAVGLDVAQNLHRSARDLFDSFSEKRYYQHVKRQAQQSTIPDQDIPYLYPHGLLATDALSVDQLRTLNQHIKDCEESKNKTAWRNAVKRALEKTRS